MFKNDKKDLFSFIKSSVWNDSWFKEIKEDDDIPEVKVSEKELTVYELTRECLDDETSNSQIRRLIDQNAVKINGDKKSDPDENIELSKDGITLKVGKKRWFKVLSK